MSSLSRIRVEEYLAPPSIDTELPLMGSSLPMEEIACLLATNPIKAREQYDRILTGTDQNPPGILFEALMGRAKTFFIQFTPDSLKDSRLGFEQALKFLSESAGLIQLPERKSEICKYLALICLEEKKYEDARAYYIEGWETCKSDRKLALDYIKFLKDQQNDPESALQICNQALLAIPNCSDFLYTRAKIHFSRQNWLKAHNDCSAFLQTGDFTKFYQIEILDLAAESCLKTLSYKTACQHLEQASKLDTDLRRRATRLKKLLETKLLRAPLSVLTGANIQLNPRERRAIAKAPEKALEFFNDLPSLYRERPSDLFWVLMGRAIACIRIQSHEYLDSARANLEQALLILAEKPSATSKHLEKSLIFYWFAHLSIRENQFDEALQYFNNSWELNRSDPTLLEDFTTFLIDQNPEAAFLLCTQAQKADSNNSRIAYCRAKIYFALEQWTSARLACASFLEKTKEDLLPALDLAAEICIKQEDYQSAYKYMHKAYDREHSFDSLRRFKKLSEMELILKEKVQPDADYPALSIAPLLKAGSEGGLVPSRKIRALELLDYALKWTKENENPLHFKALINRSRVLAKNGTKDELVAARENYEEAKLFLLEKKDEEIEKKAEIHLCLALILAAEGKYEEASNEFQKSWETLKSWDSLIQFGTFLSVQNELKKALKLVNEFSKLQDLTEANFLWVQSLFYFEAQEWNQALKICEKILSICSEKSILMVHRHALKTTLKMKDYKQAKQYALHVYCLDHSMNYIESMEGLLAAQRSAIVDEHLESLYQDPNIRLPSLSFLLEIYKDELPEHPKHHVEILLLRGQQQSTPEKATQDYEEALKIMNAHPGVFTTEKRNAAVKKLERGKK